MTKEMSINMVPRTAVEQRWTTENYKKGLTLVKRRSHIPT